MKKHLQYIDGTSDKFWQIETTGNSYTVVYGRNGTSGQTQTKSFETEADCLKAAEKQVIEKTKKGYSEDGHVTDAKEAAPKTRAAGDKQLVLDEYDEIVRSADLARLLSFLEEKSTGHTEALKKQVRKAKSYWMNYVDLSKDPGYVKGKNQYTWGTRGSAEQQRLIVLSAIALYNRAEINSWTEAIDYFEQLKAPYVLPILQWAKPSWIAGFLLDKTRTDEWRSVNYQALRELESLGLIEYNPELFALSLSRYNGYSRQENYKNTTLRLAAQILEDPVAYTRDVPQLLQYDTQLHLHSIEDYNSGRYEAGSLWQHIFNELLQQQKIERKWLLEQSLLIQTKEWNANLRSFFRKMFTELAPSEEELAALQQQIFPLYNATLSAVVNFAIDLTKKAFSHPQFNTSSFLEWSAAVAMRTDCKGGIKSLLSLWEKTAKQFPDQSEEVSHIVSDVFMVPDLSLQERAAKAIEKTGNKNDEQLSDKLVMYAPQLLGNVSSSLADFMPDNTMMPSEEIAEYTYTTAAKPLVLLDEQLVQLPADWNGILFQFGKFISSDEVIDAEIMLHIYTTMRHLFPPDAQEQLKAYSKQLINRYFNGYYKNIVRDFLIGKIEAPNTPFKEPHQHMRKSKVVSLMYKLALLSEEKMQRAGALPLLSLPSHYPHWIAPEVLVGRLLQYQRQNEPIDTVDFAIAISRMPRENVAAALPLCAQLDADIAALLLYCLGEQSQIKIKANSFLKQLFTREKDNDKPIHQHALWAVAARTHQPEGYFAELEHTALKQLPNVVAPFVPQLSMKEKWNEWKDYKTKELVRSPSWYELSFDLPQHNFMPQALLYSIDLFSRGNNVWEYHVLAASDVTYWHSLMPQNDEALALMLIKADCRIADENSDVIPGFLHVSLLPGFVFGNNGLIVLAVSCFKQKKEIRALAGEVLIQHLQAQSLDTAAFAKALSFLINEQFGPLQRFTDTLTLVKDVSPLHNTALAMLLEEILAGFQPKEKLPVNFKKLVELYFDLMTKTKRTPSEMVMTLFEKLEDVAALKPILKQLKSIV